MTTEHDRRYAQAVQDKARAEHVRCLILEARHHPGFATPEQIEAWRDEHRTIVRRNEVDEDTP